VPHWPQSDGQLTQYSESSAEQSPSPQVSGGAGGSESATSAVPESEQESAASAARTKESRLMSQ